MPQMSPMWWTTLMVMFILLFIILMTILYFNINNKMTSKILLCNKKMNWKW
uniref:ATP synthase complex subunit 8 n=1 Tax=Empoascanara angkhangica TaxID=3057149 RepID=A0AA51NH82_9HEMI|nr:ATP synthase F0 subunit 8 [Empoascanara angkhangica]WMQ52403.1 ATP synthase F0 subunit 8 [Empoascanara angkhangica]